MHLILHGEASISTAGLVLAMSDTSADDLALDEAYTFIKRPRVERLESTRRRGGRGQHSRSAW
jgi:hypothetical protein